MLWNVGILIGVYVVKAYRLKKTHESTNLQSAQNFELSKDTSKNTQTNHTEKQYDHYLNVCAVNLGITAIRLISPPVSLLNTGLFVYTSLPFYQKAKKSIVKERKIGNDVLYSVFTLVCLTQNRYVILALNNWFYFLSSKFVAKTQKQSEQMFTNVFKQLPSSVWVLKEEVEIEIPLDALQVNDIVVVNTGEVVPIDGRIIQGIAMIDQQALTGESQPAEKSPGDQVFTSTVLMSGKIYVAVEKTGIETTVSKITQMLNHSADFKTNIQLRGEEWADKGALPVLGLSLLTLGLLGPSGSLVVLSSTFGNRIRLFGALGTLNYLNIAYQKGILVKDGRALEALNQVDTLLFDKTGTLTKEQPTVGQIIVCSEHYDQDDILKYAAAAECKLAHPIAKAILNQANTAQLIVPNVDDSKYQMGYGITVSLDNQIIKVGSMRFMMMEGIAQPEQLEKSIVDSHNQGYSLVMVAINDQIRGAIEIKPSIRPEVKQIINQLRQQGIKHLSIVSGDHTQPTQKLAEELGMDSYFAEILPQNKAQIVEQLQEQGKTVCFVGDGINDTIAMKKANVSISLRGASAIATDIAQVILMDGSLSHLPQLFEISKQLDTNVRNSLTIAMTPTAINLGGAFFFNFGVPTALFIKYISFFTGIGNAMYPLKQLKQEETEIN